MARIFFDFPGYCGPTNSTKSAEDEMGYVTRGREGSRKHSLLRQFFLIDFVEGISMKEFLRSTQKDPKHILVHWGVCRALVLSIMTSFMSSEAGSQD